jgi:hypothetical protein
LAIVKDPDSTIPFQNALPGTVEIEVDRASPAMLALRTAGVYLRSLGRP